MPESPIRTVAVLILTVALLSPAYAQAPQTSATLEALDGADPVLLIQGKEVIGKRELTAVHGRYEYFFASPETKATFEKDPERYGIQLGGLCAKMGRTVSGRPSDFYVHDGRIYIFGSDDCHKKFVESPGKYTPPAAVPIETGGAAVAAGRALLDRAVAAHGGAAKIDALRTYTEVAFQTQKRAAGDVPVTLRTTRRFPDAVRIEQTMRLSDREITFGTLLTMGGAWALRPGGPPAAAPPAVVSQLERESGRDLVTIMRRRGDPGVKVAAAGTETVEGRSLALVRVQHGTFDGTLAIDPASGRVERVSYVERAGGGSGQWGTYAVTYADYRDVSGVTLPFSRRAAFNGSPDSSESWTIESIALDAPVDPALFTVPSGGGK